MASLERVPIWI